MKIAVISDTHGKMPSVLMDRLEGASLILHLGDLGPTALLSLLSSVAPTLAVQGNNDPPGLPELPERRNRREGPIKIRMRHLPWSEQEMRGLGEPTLFLHGHLHYPVLESIPRGRLLCPGAVQGARRGSPPSLAWIDLQEDRVLLRIRELESSKLIQEEEWILP
ncbi:MAG: metallophosphoesterase family protein [Candidatus Krumholzibacteria bacterium]|jgi:hypothetical protein|nr:metallophosphoesterase family protein [Candidatus Krumholzibacteria bacterium]MDP6669266.1 metallophosphoesterase family protein [Candidatus Krumholzibacteria bacterium]MDP6796348.1 metallophosphoesterase family protein [Candidatus Krumholzibacteria bacterium]MDP7021152.1 metallophosphoesterase family protein [Candidatus Krumholzibacteria bacterium]